MLSAKIERKRRSARSSLLFRSEPRGPFGLVGLSVWLVFLVFPLVNAIGHRGPLLGHLIAIVAAAAFVVSYITSKLS